MAIVQILRCNGCGASLSLDNSKCSYCHSENIIRKNENPLNIGQLFAKQFANYYKAQLQIDPMDGNAIFLLGLFYLNLKLYDYAIKNFRTAIELKPEDPEVYYYTSLSMIKGRRPKSVPFKEIREIEQLNNTAIQLGNKSKYYFLAAIVNFDFYEGNGMKIPQPGYNELLSLALAEEIEPEENIALFEHVVIRDEKLINILKP